MSTENTIQPATPDSRTDKGVGCGDLVRLLATSAEYLIGQWSRLEEKAESESDYWGSIETGGGDTYRARASALRLCIKMLRREVVRAKRRQRKANK